MTSSRCCDIMSAAAKVLLLAACMLPVWNCFEVTEQNAAENSWHDLPAMDTFGNYEEMQKYMDSMSSRRVEVIANPTMDSYISAYNLHHEKYQDQEEGRSVRAKRAAQHTPPQFIRFELADAKEPGEEVKQIVRAHRERELRTNETTTKAPASRSQRAKGRKIANPANNKTTSSVRKRRMDTSAPLDLDLLGSQRVFMYQRAMAPTKVKKSINKLPQEVHKAITYILKDTSNSKQDISQLQPQPQPQHSQQSLLYDANLNKYLSAYSAPQTTFGNSIRYVYVPVAANAPSYSEFDYPFESSKIAPARNLKADDYVMQVVPAPALVAPEAKAAEQNSVEHEFPTGEVKQSASLFGYPLPEEDKYPDLTALIGKSPLEQLNGLSYLIANEMNKQLKSQRQKAVAPKPQDNRSPILFDTVGTPKPPLSLAHRDGFTKLVVKQYEQQFKDHTPITETTEEQPAAEPAYGPDDNFAPATYDHHHHHQLDVVHITPPPPPTPTSYKHIESVAVSPNYKPIVVREQEDKDLQYASKYAFGYQVRDFHTGNDFSHKQKRDQDGVTRGQYHILLPDGRVQNVRYHADETGFHADVTFESGH